MKKLITNCSLDCFDACSIEAHIEDGRITKLIGNKNHPFTKGMICSKGRAHLDRLYSDERILSPKLKVDGEFKDISYDEAFDILKDRLLHIKENYGPKAVLHFYDSGYTGLSKNVDKMFFNCYGGATKHTGSLCWAAGIKAQAIDFGDNKSNAPELLVNSDTIIIWGRNPADTNIHMLKYLIDARKNGARLILIDPIETNTAKYCDDYIAIKPSTDGALALGIAKYLIDNQYVDSDFIREHVYGYDEFKESLQEYSLDYVSSLTGIDKEQIIEIAEAYGKAENAAIVIGYGMQRYKQGGNATRCINSLAALTGNIGNPGGGIYYSNKSIGDYISGYVDKSDKLVKDRRTYSKTKLAEFLTSDITPEIKLIFITKANPVVQVPNIDKTIEALNGVEFKVVMDLFMTDTAMQADLVLPATSVLEEDDFFYSSMFSPYLNYSQRVIEPLNGVMGEYDFFMELAKRLELTEYPYIPRDEFFRGELAPLINEFNVDYDSLKTQEFIIPDKSIAYEDLKFNTTTGKIELYSDIAKSISGYALPTFISSDRLDSEYRLQLITPHAKDSLHSQHLRNMNDIPLVYVNEEDALELFLEDGEHVKVESKQGSIACELKKTNKIIRGAIYIYQGPWIKNGAVNVLTDDIISDIGEQAAYYDCFCRIDKK